MTKLTKVHCLKCIAMKINPTNFSAEVCGDLDKALMNNEDRWIELQGMLGERYQEGMYG
ncbi:hypothetical protein Lser_V15G03925 [Lactuca serriola]